MFTVLILDRRSMSESFLFCMFVESIFLVFLPFTTINFIFICFCFNTFCHIFKPNDWLHWTAHMEIVKTTWPNQIFYVCFCFIWPMEMGEINYFCFATIRYFSSLWNWTKCLKAIFSNHDPNFDILLWFILM